MQDLDKNSIKISKKSDDRQDFVYNLHYDIWEQFGELYGKETE